MRTTLKDIAVRAGVSTALVSNYLNGNRAARMSDSTRERIENALQELNYQASWAARALRTGKSNIIGLVSTMLSYEVNQTEMLAIFAETTRRGGQLFVQYTGDDPTRLKSAVLSLLSQGCDIVIVSGNLTDVQCEELMPLRSRLVLINSNKKSEIPGRTIRYDYEDAVLTALRDLEQHGHRNVCYLCEKTWRIDQRMNAFSTMHPEEHIIDCNLEGETGRSPQWFASLLADNPECTAYFCINDFIALELMQYIIKSGKRVPEDYSILGFDNVQAASLTVPELSSIARPLPAAAECALDMCHKISDDKNYFQETTVLKCVYIPRNSIGAAAR